MRCIRKTLSIKVSQEANLADTLNRMWLAFDPVVNHKGLKLHHSARTVKFMATITDVFHKNSFSGLKMNKNFV